MHEQRQGEGDSEGAGRERARARDGEVRRTERVGEREEEVARVDAGGRMGQRENGASREE